MGENQKEVPSGNGQKIANIMSNMNWPTVVLIALTGGGNWLATARNGTQIDSGREQVIRQVADLHNSLDGFERRQIQMLDGIHDSLRNQGVMLNNQQEMLNEIKKASP